ncbi:DNA-binding transcriptional LysR family regulator [Sphingomonas sp. PP-F2F-A104-K0414]|uniref:LysR family transcriptional regulator n=1 Tax=Sphingomonas sp. PP-F2F-A104-K0414 TaxID=2135661 RepID=UPI0010507031|nr:LysR family transcriptional regulator [Sphingomonas sp. PP-F2F-A104-K0414]TCP96771.1 DNA-binding transcriptional LysR family regulator [Sphingomonas sp. PP-F2F-A104-K0414]
MADKFEDLRTFITVMSAGGVNAAAAELGIAKSAVSRRLSDLEKRLGVSLIERASRRFEATAVGLEYERRARLVLASLEELDSFAVPQTERRSVTISADTAMISHVLVPAIARVNPKLQNERILLRFAATQDHANAGEADVIIAAKVTPDLEYRDVFSSRRIICASPAYIASHGTPEEAKHLDGHFAVVVDDGAAATWQLGERTRAMAKTAMITPDMDAAAAAAVAGIGLAQLPDFVVAAALGDGRLVRLMTREEPQPTQIRAFYRKGIDLSGRRVIDALTDALSPIGVDK